MEDLSEVLRYVEAIPLGIRVRQRGLKRIFAEDISVDLHRVIDLGGCELRVMLLPRRHVPGLRAMNRHPRMRVSLPQLFGRPANLSSLTRLRLRSWSDLFPSDGKSIAGLPVEATRESLA